MTRNDRLSAPQKCHYRHGCRSFFCTQKPLPIGRGFHDFDELRGPFSQDHINTYDARSQLKSLFFTESIESFRDFVRI